MKIQMELMSDVIFGDGRSIPGAEDISVLRDEYGFPYYKGTTFKGILREETERYLDWQGDEKRKDIIQGLFGTSGSDTNGSLVCSDFVLSSYVRKMILQELSNPEYILDSLTNTRTFTAIDENGIVKQGSLRIARCVNKGLAFYCNIISDKSDEQLLENVISSIKWLGSMRNRGFGKVRMTVIKEDANEVL